ncbi:hypothetical protein NW761_010377 [Fusarium oxysporum]|nr:hypothetical protein NW758_008857 [Fusarium oxysporum]KAJ4081831.1 hypothetical protein NW761_010377 [Fusarium oxysporum]KAJ4094151.1 hypothetical protein NW769_012216 [Fusarium oxysporum]KAJ4215281.1 hypothetical protein NW760_014415 [Fusarium oxysporum]WKT51465.1 Leucine-rich repeat domain superfamily [Fusarium oxysporum f. sp. vasinfectum]
MTLINPETTGLVYLPRDILVEIFSYFCLHCRGDLRPIKGVGTPHQHKQRREPQQPDQKSWYSIDKYALFSLAASCKALHPIAEDILYHDFAPGYGDSELSELYTYGHRLNQFMRTVGRRKDLAEKVRMIFVHPKHSNTDVKQIVLSLKQGAADLGIDIVKAWGYRAKHFMNPWRPARRTRWGEEEYLFMLNSAFTDEILEYPALSYHVGTNNFYKVLHHELIPMLIALLPKLGYIIYKSNSIFDSFKNTALEALGVTELPCLRTLEIDKDLFSILKRAPDLEQLDIITSPFFGKAGDSFGERSKIRTLRLENISSPSALSEPLSFAAKDLRSLVIESCEKFTMRFFEFSMPGFSADVIEKIRDYRHSLETLHLDLRDVIESSPSYRPDCTFHGFEKLEHVFLNTWLVFHTLRDLEGIDGPTVEDRHAITPLLPPSIVSLHLVWDGLDIDRLEQGLMGLVDATTDRFQHLKLVGLDYAEMLDETVRHAMLEAGIEFTYERWPVSFEGEPGAEEPDDEWIGYGIQ